VDVAAQADRGADTAPDAADDAQTDAATSCSVKAQNCPQESSRCTIVTAPSGGRTTACIAPTGNILLDQPCLPLAAGGDTCASGLFCTTIGHAPGEGRCRKLCEKTADCAANLGCYAVSLRSQPMQFGFCMEHCAAFGNDCVQGTSCKVELMTEGVGLFCVPSGFKAEGASCGNSAECVSGANCVNHQDVGAALCTAICDDTHACASGVCRALPGAVGAPPSYGGCFAAPPDAPPEAPAEVVPEAPPEAPDAATG
jgi:hypothetical protein